MDLGEWVKVREQANIEGLQKGDTVCIFNPNTKTWVYKVRAGKNAQLFEEVKHEDLIRDTEYITTWLKHGIYWHGKYVRSLTEKRSRICFYDPALLPPDRLFVSDTEEK